jgi:tetratricopeptide (TPR) repeat protein
VTIRHRLALLARALVPAVMPVVMPVLMTGVLVGVVYVKCRPAERLAAAPAPVGSPGGASTRRGDLDGFIADLERRRAAHPNDAATAARLADALLRQARVANNPGLSLRAEDVLKQALAREPEHYEALRAMGAVLLSQHRFREAIDVATRARALDPNDAWNEGVIGDGHLELGEYDRAFAAFDRMMTRRPSAAAYARASYARELQGDLEGALRLMRMASEGTSADDSEGQAWHYAQIGDLLFQRGRLSEARTHYEHADFVYPGHPFAAIGLARVKAAQGNIAGALAGYEALMARGPSPFLAARIGELRDRLGRHAEAEQAYALAEDGWRNDTPEPTLLAAFLAAHDRAPVDATASEMKPAVAAAAPAADGRARAIAVDAVSAPVAPHAAEAASSEARARRLADAMAIAEKAAQARRDIFTMDALAWARFKNGRIAEAREASAEAMRTGTRDRIILYHAAAIADAAGDRASARTLVERALDGHPAFDVIAAPEARALQARLCQRP